MTTKNISSYWDCEPYLKSALINAGERHDSAAIDSITADLHDLHPDMQRDPSEGAGFVPTSDRLARARGLL